MKITVPGDLMIEPPVLKYGKQPDGSYDFSEIFRPTKALFREADLLLGNLETPLAGEEAKYTQHYYAFNAPDSYADAVKQAGFHMVSTANNHTFDRGFEGAERTLDVLDAKGIGHHGSARKGEAHREAWYTTVGDTKIAVVAYTYGTNFSGSGLGCLAEGEHAGMVNLLRPQKETVYQPGVFRGPDWVDKLFSFLQAETRGWIKKFVGLEPNYPRADDRLDKKTMAPYVARFQADIRKAKENADFVIFMPHVGGQFNRYPGAVSEYVMDKALEAGADAVLAGHSHMVQRGLLRKGVPCFYSLGNFSFGGNIYPADYDTAIIQQEVILSGDGTVTLGERTLIPCSLSSMEKRNNFQPTPYEEGSKEYQRVLSKLDGSYSGSNLPVH